MADKRNPLVRISRSAEKMDELSKRLSEAMGELDPEGKTSRSLLVEALNRLGYQPQHIQEFLRLRSRAENASRYNPSREPQHPLVNKVGRSLNVEFVAGGAPGSGKRR